MKERVAFAEQTEREVHGGSFLWKAEVKTAPEPQCRKVEGFALSKRCRTSALKNRICWNPKEWELFWYRDNALPNKLQSRWNRAFHD